MPKTVSVPKKTERTQRPRHSPAVVRQERTRAVNFRMMEDDRLEFSFSSERAVERWWGNEILSHEVGSVNLERVGGMAFLWNHCPDSVLGKVESIEIRDKRGYAQVKWSKNTFAQEKKQDVIDGILTNVSFSYQIDKYETEDDENYFCTRWTPLEISLVSVPADPTVGIGRSLTIKEKMPTIEETTRNDEITRIRTIQGMATAHGFPELADSMIASGATIQEAQGRYLEKIKETPQSSVARPVNPLELTDKEQKTYSIVRAINAVIDQDWSKAGFERECSQEIAKRSGKSPKGFFVPLRDLRVENRAPFSTAANPTGGYTVQTDVLSQNFIDLFRNKTMVIQLGAMMLSGLQGNVSIPSQATGATTYWIAENGTITESEATFGQVPLNPKTIAARSQFSRQMLQQSTMDIEQFIRNDFAKIIAIGIDAAAISGTGANNQPTGVLNTAGIGSVALGTNGGAPTWVSMVNLCRALAINNADMGRINWLTNPYLKAKLMTTPKQASGVEGTFILADPGDTLLGYPFYATNQVPNNLTKGSGTNLSAAILGNWEDLIIGEWGVLDILPNPFGAGFNSGAIDIRVMQTVDIAVRHPESFSAATDLISA